MIFMKDVIIWIIIGATLMLVFLTIAYIAIKQDHYNQCVAVMERTSGIWKDIVATACYNNKPWWIS